MVNLTADQKSSRESTLDSNPPTTKPAMRIRWLLAIGILLGIIGASLTVALGVLYLKPYLSIRTMIKTSCVTVNSSLTEETVYCICTSNGGGACQSQYPCLKVWVNFSILNGTEINNATLYDNQETFILQKPAQRCSVHQCDTKISNNVAAVRAFDERYGEPGSMTDCYYEPSDLTFAIVDVISLSQVVHAIFWPVLAFVLGAGILLAHICDCFGLGQSTSSSSSPFNSLEKPWLRHAERNYEKVKTLAEYQKDDEEILETHENQ